MNAEFKEPKNYKLIFKAIALGHNRLGEICNYTGLDKSIVSKYLDVLCKLHILKDEAPVTASPKSKYKKRLYFISDPYFNFWFRYIYPNRIDLEANRENEVLAMIKKEFPRYCGHMFEVLTLELFIKRQIPCDLSLSKIGRWWHKDKEIDIVGLNEQNNEILFIECKWSDLRLEEAESVLRELMGKSGFVDWNNGKRKEYFGIVARKIEGKDQLKKRGLFVFDLDDL